MRKIIMITLLIATGLTSVAQSIESVLQQIEENNTTLVALRQQAEVQKLGNRTGLAPANPEAEFSYLWGNPSAIGNRTDFSVKQTFDFPATYIHRGKIAGLHDENAELRYKMERINVLLTARKICIELVYRNALVEAYAARLKTAESIARLYKAKLEKGEANILEYNKAQLNLAALQAEEIPVASGIHALMAELSRLNGGKEINNYELQITNYEDTIRNSQFVIRNFDEWYAKIESEIPMLQYLNGQIEIDRQAVKLNRAMALPQFSAGYMSEKVEGEHFRGITLGMSIPLWENKNRVKQAKAQAQLAETQLKDHKEQYRNRLLILCANAFALQQKAAKLRQSIDENNNEPFLKKALDAGEISLLNYFLEIEFYYDAVDKALEAERDFELAKAELYFGR